MGMRSIRQSCPTTEHKAGNNSGVKVGPAHTLHSDRSAVWKNCSASLKDMRGTEPADLPSSTAEQHGAASALHLLQGNEYQNHFCLIPEQQLLPGDPLCCSSHLSAAVTPRLGMVGNEGSL